MIEVDSLKFKSETFYTKREPASLVAKISYPIGLNPPFTVRSKLLLQSLWAQGVGLDNEIRGIIRYPSSLRTNGCCDKCLASLVKIGQEFQVRAGFQQESAGIPVVFLRNAEVQQNSRSGLLESGGFPVWCPDSGGILGLEF